MSFRKKFMLPKAAWEVKTNSMLSTLRLVCMPSAQFNLTDMNKWYKCVCLPKSCYHHLLSHVDSLLQLIIPLGGGVYWNHFVCLSICSSVHVSDHVCSVSPEPLNHFFLPNLVWWCIITRQCVMQKNWFTIFKFKVTAKGYIIKIWLFLVYLLNCWPVCNQTWFDSTAS